MQIKLNCIDPTVFPLPQTIVSQRSTPARSQGQQASQASAAISRLEGSNLLKYNLRPATRVDTVETCEQPLTVPAIQAQLKTGQQQSCVSSFVLESTMSRLLRNIHALPLKRR